MLPSAPALAVCQPEKLSKFTVYFVFKKILYVYCLFIYVSLNCLNKYYVSLNNYTKFMNLCEIGLRLILPQGVHHKTPLTLV